MAKRCTRSVAHGHQLAALLGTAALILALSSGADAACTWTWDCSRGPCRQIPLCDSTLDLPSPRPPSVSPIPAPSIRPLPRPVLPPLGTRSCEDRYLCDGMNCRWQTVCQ